MLRRYLFVIISMVMLLNISPSWAQKLEPFGLKGTTVTSLAISPQSGMPGGIILVAGTYGRGVFIRSVSSLDSTWRMTGLEGKKVTAVDVYHWGVGPADFNVLFAAVEPEYEHVDSTLLYRYADEGKWTPSDSGIDRTHVHSITAMASLSSSGHEPRGPLFAGCGGQVFRSVDIGASWEKMSLQMRNISSIELHQPSGEVWVGGSWARAVPGIARSEDQGNNWRIMTPLIGQNTVYSLAIHPEDSDRVYAGIWGAVITTTDGGKNWTYSSLCDMYIDFRGLSIDSANPEHIWTGGVTLSDEFALYESFDGGGKWYEVEAPGISNISSLVADPMNDGVVYVGTLGDGVWRYESSEPPLSDYFPMQIGNEWTFSGILAESIVDTVRVNDNLYYQFSSFRDFRDVLLHMNKNNELILSYGDDEQMWLDFAAAVGDTWTVRDPVIDVTWLVHLENKCETVTVPAGTFTDCYRFWFDFGCCDNDWMEWYAPGIGPVKRILYGFAVIEYPLLSAIINEVPISNKKGDINGDGDVDVKDVMWVVNILLNLVTPTPNQLSAADYNSDGVINILDVVRIVQYILENPSPLHVKFKDVTDYGNFCVNERGPEVIMTETEWNRLWELYWNVYDEHGNKTPPPEIDFAKEMVLGVFWGGECRYSGCTNRSPSIKSVWIEDDTLRVRVGPMRDLGPCDMCVCPLHLIQTKKYDLPVVFVGDVPR